LLVNRSHNTAKVNTRKQTQREPEDDDDDDDDDNDNDDKNDKDNNSNDDGVSTSGFSNGSSDKQTKCAEQNKHNNDDDSTSMKSMVGKPVYEEELLLHGWNDSVAMDIQLIKGVLPDLFAVLKFLESDDDLVYNGTICCYFIKKLQIAETKQYEWWKRNSNAVRKSIDGRRASVSNLIKWSFMGKCFIVWKMS